MALVSDNRPRLYAAMCAVQCLGAVPVPLYQDAVAEEMVFGKDKVTSGAQSDIEQATRLARMMVTRWGFSPELGTVAYGENQEEVFLGHSVARSQNVSEETARIIDMEVRRIVTEGWEAARKILTDLQKWSEPFGTRISIAMKSPTA